VRPIEALPVAIIRTCFRCKKEFHTVGGPRICPSCGRPKGRLNPNLSFREKQVVDLVCKAMLNKQIAYELRLTEGTIKEYLNRIFQKLKVSNRTGLAVWALTRQSTKTEMSDPWQSVPDVGTLSNNCVAEGGGLP
jgi:DNA-binding NarL/FixJ family response regulator